MRSFLFMFCLAVSATIFSQGKKEIKVTKTKIVEMKKLSDIISDIPKDCKVYNFIFSANIYGSLKQFTCMGEGISPELKAIINAVPKGKPVFLEDIKSSCPRSHAPSYKIILD